MRSIETDILVVGAGLAGMLFSLELARRKPDLKFLIINKKAKSSSSYLAQGGISAVLPNSYDSINQHVQDTLAAGCYSNERSVVEYFISRAPDAIKVLEQWGINFDKAKNGTSAFALEGGHSYPRVLHHKDFTGKHIMDQLYKEAINHFNIEIRDNAEVFELVKNREGNAVIGAYAWEEDTSQAIAIKSSVTVLATGGVGNLFYYTTNPSTANGHGIAMAEKTGAKLKELMNIQFHPTALWKNTGCHLPLISEALRGSGAILRNEYGLPFMEEKHPLKDLAPRDIVSRYIIAELDEQGLPYVYLDATKINKEDWAGHFPSIFRTCTHYGIDPRKEWIPVVPAAHYSCGGVETDVKGQTCVDNLFVIGETACTGFHGANRLASNSLLEATLMAVLLAEHLSSFSHTSKTNFINLPSVPEISRCKKAEKKLEMYFQESRKIMQQYCGVNKNTAGLQKAAELLEEMENLLNQQQFEKHIELVNLKLTLYSARRIIGFSMAADENKGVFYNQDLIPFYQ